MLTINLSLSVYNIIITMIIMIYFISGKRLHIRLNRFFAYMCICNIIMIAGDITDWLSQGDSGIISPTVLWWGILVFYISSAPLLLAFVCYIMEYLSDRVKVSKAFFYTAVILTTTHIVWIIISQFNEMFYYFDEHNHYVRGEWFLLSQLIPFLIYLVGCSMIIIFRKHMRKRDFICLATYIALPAVANIIQVMNYGIALLNTAITINILLIFINIQSERELRMKEQEKELAESRIDIMLSQIKPHFLYNSLTSIRQLCELDPAEAKDTIRDFSFFLRANMDSLTNKAPIPFSQELAHVEHYLKLEKQRFRERMNVIYDIQVEDFSVPPLSLQPLVENAVRHGIVKRSEGGTIKITTEEKEDVYLIAVSDDGVGFNTDSLLLGNSESHIGITNVKSRLQSMCKGTLDIKSDINEGAVVTIEIPKGGGAHEVSIIR